MFATYVAALLIPYSYVRFMTTDATMQVEFSLQWFYVAFVLIAVLALGTIGTLIQNDQLMHIAFLNILLGIAGFIADSILTVYERAWISDVSSPWLPVAISVIFSVAIAQVIAGIMKHVLAHRREGKMMIDLSREEFPTPRIASTSSDTIFSSLFGILMLVPAYVHVLMASKFSWIILLAAGLSIIGVVVTTWILWKIENQKRKIEETQFNTTNSHIFTRPFG